MIEGHAIRNSPDEPEPPAGHATPIFGPQRASLRAHRHGSTSSRTWQKAYRVTLPSASPERRLRPSSRTLASAPTDQAGRGHGRPCLRAAGAHRHGSTSSRTWQKAYRLTLPSAHILAGRWGAAHRSDLACRGRRAGRRENGERGGPQLLFRLSLGERPAEGRVRGLTTLRRFPAHSLQPSPGGRGGE